MASLIPAVHCQCLSKSFGDASAQQTILDEAELSINPGEFVVVLGRSGSGKSTLLNLLGAMDRPSSGSIKIDGRDISLLDESERTLFRRHSLGFIFQAYNLITTLDVIENIRLPLALNGSRNESLAYTLLDELELRHKARSQVENLSGGEQQRVAIARALVHSPKLILADEPTGNLDVETARATISLLNRLVKKHGQTLIMATHSQEVVAYADRIVTIKDRKIVDA